MLPRGQPSNIAKGDKQEVKIHERLGYRHKIATPICLTEDKIVLSPAISRGLVSGTFINNLVTKENSLHANQ